MFITVIVGVLIGALLAFAEYCGYARVLLDLLTHWQEVLPHIGEVAKLPMQQQIMVVQLLPRMDLAAMAPHMGNIMRHKTALLAALPKLSPHLEVCMRQMPLLMPKLDLLAPLLPRLSTVSDEELRVLLSVSPTLLKGLDRMTPAQLDPLLDSFLALLPKMAKHLEEMDRNGTLQLCLDHLDDVVVPVMPILRSNAALQEQLPLLVKNARKLFPHVGKLLPYANEMIVYAPRLLADEKVWNALEPHLGALMDVMPQLIRHINVIMANLDAALVHLPRLAPCIQPLSVHVDKLVPHIGKLMQHCDALMDYWPQLSPHMDKLLSEIDILILYIPRP